MNKVDIYIAEQEEHIQIILRKLRELILEHQELEETFKYRMPTYMLKKNIFHFAAHKNHLGIYPSPEPITIFKEELKKYNTAKGSIQFQYSEEIPYELIIKILRYQINKYK